MTFFNIFCKSPLRSRRVGKNSFVRACSVLFSRAAELSSHQNQKNPLVCLFRNRRKKFHTVSKFSIIRFWYPEYLYYLFKNLSDILFLETSRMSLKSVWETTLISFAQLLVFFKCLLSRIKNTKTAILIKVNFQKIRLFLKIVKSMDLYLFGMIFKVYFLASKTTKKMWECSNEYMATLTLKVQSFSPSISAFRFFADEEYYFIGKIILKFIENFIPQK